MTRGEMVTMLTKQAAAFSKDRAWFIRNAHMHTVRDVPQDVVDNVLAGFLNYTANQQGLDLGMYVSDLKQEREGK